MPKGHSRAPKEYAVCMSELVREVTARLDNPKIPQKEVRKIIGLTFDAITWYLTKKLIVTITSFGRFIPTIVKARIYQIPNRPGEQIFKNAYYQPKFVATRELKLTLGEIKVDEDKSWLYTGEEKDKPIHLFEKPSEEE